MTAAAESLRAVIDAFVAEARAVTVSDYAGGLPGLRVAGVERVGPCPACGGRDRFSVNLQRQVWNCRGATGGRDAIGLAAHVMGYDLARRDDFLAACAEVLGCDVPGPAPTEADLAAARQRAAEARAKARARAIVDEETQNAFRAREIERAVGILNSAVPIDDYAAKPVRDYLAARGVLDWSIPVSALRLKCAPALDFWHGVKGDKPVSLHCGPAMVAGFWNPVTKAVTGCHLTWIDLSRPPKFRPLIEVADAATGEVAALPTKKMRGHKKGSLIPMAGRPSATRWLGGEGIETVLAVMLAEARAAGGLRPDTFYFAAGDLGNLAGPRDPQSDFPHPHLTKVDAAGRARAVKVQGATPAGETGVDCVAVPDHVQSLILAADGDSERVATAAAMARAKARHAAPGRAVAVVWPGSGDFADRVAVETAAKGEGAQ